MSTNNANNRISAGSYDTAGNQTSVNGNTPSYDAESRIRQIADSSGTETILYDGRGERVESKRLSNPLESRGESGSDEPMQKRAAEEVERVLKGYEESGLSRQQYCRREGIPVTRLDYYRQPSSRKAAAGRRAASKLVEVKLEAAAVATGSMFTLVLVNGRRIESGWNFGDGEMARRIRIAKAV